ncbi:MAG: FAD:protein FMN transferase [Candidatus Omnitrophota bacterium]
MKALFWTWILGFGILASGCQPSQPLYKERRLSMGTFVQVMAKNKEAAEIVFKELQRIEDLLSKYKPESEVSRLNEARELKVSDETFYVIKKAVAFWQASRGAFDITVGPLMDLWGFTTGELTVPDHDQIAKSLKGVGSNKIYMNKTDNVIKFLNSGMKIDLGGIGKGYAIDCAVKKLEQSKFDTCLINVGGNVYGMGKKFGQSWRVAIQNPNQPGTVEQFNLTNQCVATAGAYEQGGHIMDPRTGYPADAGLSSVTIIAPDCLTADALSTAIFVLGKEKGEALLKKFPNVKARLIEKED